jgi:hypothetical protein
MFENGDGWIHLHPDFNPANQQSRRAAESSAPFAHESKREIIWENLAERAATLGLLSSEPSPTTADPDLHVMIGDERLSAAMMSEGRYLFLLPPSDGTVALASRTALPRDHRPWLDDDRRLGVMVKRLALRFGHVTAAMELDHPALGDGWWDPEWHDAATLRRWTNSVARLEVPAGTRMWLEVEIDAGGALNYPAVDADPPLQTVQPVPTLAPWRAVG